jgi:CelD/BcsL family acetyltransferase involved in cellulose biosynthesis
LIDWDLKQWALTPTADGVGPFVRSGFLRAWWESFGTGDIELAIDDTGLAPLWRDSSGDGVLRFAGEADLTDYHSPLGIDGARLLVEYVLNQRSGTRYDFDSLPAGAAESISAFFTYSGLDVPFEQHAVALRLDLSDSFDDYLMTIGKKQRHEIRRKARRFTELLGDPSLVAGNPFDDLDAFFQMHRAAGGEKGGFMTQERENLFRDLFTVDGARLDVLRDGQGTAVAAAFGFQDADAYYLYNSAYDPSRSEASPGIVMLSKLIEQSIGSELRWFDFLKGDETYKYRLGAVERPLFRISGIR